MTQVPKPFLEHLSSGIIVSDTVEVLTLSNSDSVVLDSRTTVFEYRGLYNMLFGLYQLVV